MEERVAITLWIWQPMKNIEHSLPFWTRMFNSWGNSFRYQPCNRYMPIISVCPNPSGRKPEKLLRVLRHTGGFHKLRGYWWHTHTYNASWGLQLCNPWLTSVDCSWMCTLDGRIKCMMSGCLSTRHCTIGTEVLLCYQIGNETSVGQRYVQLEIVCTVG